MTHSKPTQSYGKAFRLLNLFSFKVKFRNYSRNSEDPLASILFSNLNSCNKSTHFSMFERYVYSDPCHIKNWLKISIFGIWTDFWCSREFLTSWKSWVESKIKIWIKPSFQPQKTWSNFEFMKIQVLRDQFICVVTQFGNV